MCVSPSSILQGGAQLAQGFSDAGTYKANARMAMIEGKSAIMSAEDRAAQIRRAGDRLLSSNRAIQAASGVDLTYGSADEVNRETAANVEKDALMASYSGRLAFSQKAYEAQLLKRQAKSAVFNSALKATGTILGGTSFGSKPLGGG